MYPSEFVTLLETLQNSIDAIQKSTKDRGSVNVWLDLDNESVKIIDNGRGFPFNISLLGLGGTDKDSSDWTLGGNIGVGLKVVILSTRNFELKAIHGGRRWSANVTDSYRYLLGSADEVPISYVEPVVDENPSGTELSYSFPDGRVTEFVETVFGFAKQVDNVLATTTSDKFRLAVEYYFRTYSYAGNVSRLLGSTEIKISDITINFICRTPTGRNKLQEQELKAIFEANDTFTTRFVNKHWDFAEAVGRSRPGVSRPAILTMDIQPGGLIGQYSQNYVYARGFTDRRDFEKLLVNPYIREPPDVSSYQRLFDQISGMYVIIGSTPVVKKYMIETTTRHFIAASGIPSVHMLDKPSRGGQLGYIGNIHLIVNVKAKLNYGKQTITNTRLVGSVSRFFNDAYRATLRNVAKAIVGGSPGFTEATGVQTHMDVMGRRDLNLPSLTIMKEPLNEIEVIALFYELVGRGYLNEYRTYALYTWQQYDGKVMTRNPGEGSFRQPVIDPDIPVIEFKFKVSELIADFEEGTKRAADIHVLVAWEDDYTGSHMDYEVIELAGTELEDTAIEHVAKCLHQRSSGHKIQLLLLQNIIARIRAGSLSPRTPQT
jgi:hypothetical protein